MVLPMKNMSQVSLASVEDLLNMTFGSPDHNVVDFRVMHALLLLLARSMRLLEREVLVKMNGPSSVSNTMSIGEMKISARSKTKKGKPEKDKSQTRESDKYGKGETRHVGKADERDSHLSEDDFSESDEETPAQTKTSQVAPRRSERDRRVKAGQDRDDYSDEDSRIKGGKGQRRGEKSRRPEVEDLLEDDYEDDRAAQRADELSRTGAKTKVRAGEGKEDKGGRGAKTELERRGSRERKDPGVQTEKLLVVELRQGSDSSGTLGEDRPMSIATKENFKNLLAQVMELRKRYSHIDVPGMDLLEAVYRNDYDIADPMAILQLSARLEYTERAIIDMNNILQELASRPPKTDLKAAGGATAAPAGREQQTMSKAPNGGQQATSKAPQGGQQASTVAPQGEQQALSVAPQSALDDASVAPQGALDAASVTPQGGLLDASVAPQGEQYDASVAPKAMQGEQAPKEDVVDTVGPLKSAMSYASKRGKDNISIASKKTVKGLKSDFESLPEPTVVEVMGPIEEVWSEEIGVTEDADTSNRNPRELVTYSDYRQRLKTAQTELPKLCIPPTKRIEFIAFGAIKSTVEIAGKLVKALCVDAEMESLEESIRNYAMTIAEIDLKYSTQLVDSQEELTEMQQTLDCAVDFMAEALANRKSDTEGLTDLSNKLNNLQEDLYNTDDVQKDLDMRQDELGDGLHILLEEINRLEAIKSSRAEVEMELGTKAGVNELNGILTKVQFGAASGEIQKNLAQAFDTFNSHENFWQKCIDELHRDCNERAHKLQVESFKEDAFNKIASLRQQLEFMLEVVGEPRHSHDTRLVTRQKNCLSCGAAPPEQTPPVAKSRSGSGEPGSERFLQVPELVIHKKKTIETDGGGDRDEKICYPGLPIPHPFKPRDKICTKYRVCGESSALPAGDKEGVSKAVNIKYLQKPLKDPPLARKVPCVPCKPYVPKVRKQRSQKRLPIVTAVSEMQLEEQEEEIVEEEVEAEMSDTGLDLDINYYKFSSYSVRQ